VQTTWPLYLLFVTIPFWHVRPFEHISVYEMAVMVNVLASPLYLARRGVRWNRTDLVVFLFGLYGLVAVLVGSSSVYESMRVFRYIVLGPTLLYFILRVIQPDASQLPKGMVLFSISVAAQALTVIYYVLTYGERPVGDAWRTQEYEWIVASIVSFSVLAAMASSAAFYLAREVSGWKFYSLFAVGLLNVIGLLASGTRAAVVGFVVLFPLSGWVIRRVSRRVLFVGAMYLMLLVFGTSIFAAALSRPSIAVHGAGREKRSVERVLDVKSYKADLSGRLALWGRLVREGFSSPTFGQGLASYDVGIKGGTGFRLGSAHNAFVSAFYTSGLIGLGILLFLFHSGFVGIFRLYEPSADGGWISRFLAVSFFVLTLVSLTNDLTAGRGNLLMFLLALGNYRAGVDDECSREATTGARRLGNRALESSVPGRAERRA